MYILKLEYLEKRGASQDTLFASTHLFSPFLMVALTTMIELVDINEATFKK